MTPMRFAATKSVAVALLLDQAPCSARVTLRRSLPIWTTIGAPRLGDMASLSSVRRWQGGVVPASLVETYRATRQLLLQPALLRLLLAVLLLPALCQLGRWNVCTAVISARVKVSCATNAADAYGAWAGEVGGQRPRHLRQRLASTRRTRTTIICLLPWPSVDDRRHQHRPQQVGPTRHVHLCAAHPTADCALL